jgi:WD40 repeat protein
LQAEVTAIQVDRSGEVFAIGDEEGGVAVWTTAAAEAATATRSSDTVSVTSSGHLVVGDSHGRLTFFDPGWSGPALRAAEWAHPIERDGEQSLRWQGPHGPARADPQGLVVDAYTTGGWLAAATWPNRIEVFDGRGARKRELTIPDELVRQIAYDRTGRLYVATGREVLAFEESAPAPIARLPQPRLVSSLAVSPDGSSLLAGVVPGFQRLSLPNLTPLATSLHPGGTREAAFTPSGQMVTTSEDGAVTLWTADGVPVATAGLPGRISADGSRIARPVTGWLEVRALTTGQVRRAFMFPERESLLSPRVARGPRSLAVVGDGPRVRIVDRRSGEPRSTVTCPGPEGSTTASAAAWDERGQCLAVWCGEGVQLWRERTGGDGEEWTSERADALASALPGLQPDLLVFAQDDRLVAGTADRVKVLGLTDGASEEVKLPGTGKVWTRDGALELSWRPLAAVIVADAMSGETVREIFTEQDATSSISLSANGRRLLHGNWHSSTRSSHFSVMDVDGGRELASWDAPGLYQAAALSSDGSMAAYAIGESACIRTLRAGKERCFPHRSRIWSIALDAGGALLAAGDSASAHVWSVERGERVAIVPSDGIVTSLAFDRESDRLVVGSREVPAFSWWLGPERLAETGCRRAGRRLTSEEESEYLGRDGRAEACTPGRAGAP